MGSRLQPPESLAGFVQGRLRSVGLHVSRWPPQLTLERHLLDIFELLDINCVIDVGANRGDYARLLRQLGYADRIVSFEPSSESYRALCEGMRADRHWLGHQIALSDRDGTGRLQLSGSMSEFNSLHQVSDYGAGSRYQGHLNYVATEEVPLRRLDEMLDQVTSGIETPRIFLKVDTQGHDLHVVRGAERVLDRILALQVELAARQLYRDVPSFSDTLKEYEALGYLPRGFVPISTERDGMVVIEWDCVLVRAR